MRSPRRSKTIVRDGGLIWAIHQHPSGYWYYTVCAQSGRQICCLGSWPRAIRAYHALRRDYSRVYRQRLIRSAS